jgi:thiamine-phosphate diphosphorylase
VSVAQAAGADGVQLGEASRTVADARERADGGPLLIGRSVHDAADAIEAERQDADFVMMGAVYATATHPDQRPAGIALVRKVADAIATPTLGIGGITNENATEIIGAGAMGVAVIRGVLGARDPEVAARDLYQAVRQAWAARSRA